MPEFASGGSAEMRDISAGGAPAAAAAAVATGGAELRRRPVRPSLLPPARPARAQHSARRRPGRRARRSVFGPALSRPRGRPLAARGVRSQPPAGAALCDKLRFGYDPQNNPAGAAAAAAAAGANRSGLDPDTTSMLNLFCNAAPPSCLPPQRWFP